MISLAVALALQSTTALVDNAADPIGDLIAQASPEARETGGQDDVRVMAPMEPGVRCSGEWREGSFQVCRVAPLSRVTLGEVSATADANGYVVLAIPRRAPDALVLTVDGGSGSPAWRQELSIAQREYNLQQVNGVPQATVTPDPSTLPRRQREYAQKQAAFNSVWDGQGFLDGFTHPADGLVTLAEPDMFYEGGLIFIDHGHGLISAFLHMSGVEVLEGDIVEQGQLIGAMGAGGRATGSHLDWRVKLRNQFYADPQSLLDLDLSDLD